MTTLQDNIDPEVYSLLQQETQYVVDDILGFLNNFVTTLQNQVQDLDGALDRELNALNKVIRELESKKNSRAPECEVYYKEVQFRQGEEGQVTSHVLWMRNRIQRNHGLIQKLYEDRCLSHVVYITFLANAKHFLRMIALLRKAISSYNVVEIQYVSVALEQFADDLSVTDQVAVQGMFMELKNLKKKIQENDKKNMKKEEQQEREALAKYGTFLLQSTQDVDDEQEDSTGISKVDQLHDDLRARHNQPQQNFDLYEVKDQLLAIIDSIRDEIEKNLDQRLSDELTTNIAVSDYIEFMQREIQDLEHEIEESQQPKGSSLEKLKEAQANLDRCEEDLKQISSNLESIRQQIELYSNNRGAFRDKLELELQLLQQILALYGKALGQVSDEFKMRIDDGLEDRSYPQTEGQHKRKLKESYQGQAETFTDDINNRAEELAKQN